MRLGPLIRHVADFCYPPTCAVCDAAADAWPLCPGCDQKFKALCLQPYCQQCAMPIAAAGAPCPHCVGEGLYPYERFHRLCNFDDPVRQMIHAMKFHHAWSLGEFLADRLLDQPGVRDGLAAVDVIVPVPLHITRQLQRGYNQAEVMARRLARRTGRALASPAVRLVQTDAQTHTRSKSERIANLRHAFGMMDASAVAGKRVAVVDDVRTTAATLQSFGRCLRQARPERIEGFIVAVADAHGRDFERV